MIYLLARIVHGIAQLLTLIVFIDVVLSYFMSPFHPVRQALDRVVEPMLAPIRRVMPRTGMLDFSPFVLLILIQVVDMIITRILYSL